MLLNLIANSLRGKRPADPVEPDAPAILVIRPGGVREIVCSLPLIRSIRLHFPRSTITVACDAGAVPIAVACGLVNQVLVLRSGGFLTIVRDASLMQGFDWVIAATGNFDQRVASLTRLTNARVRVGLAKTPSPADERDAAEFFTDVVTPPEPDHEEHEVERLLRLLHSLGIIRASGEVLLTIPEQHYKFAQRVLAEPSFHDSDGKLKAFVLVNVVSEGIRFSEADFYALLAKVLKSSPYLIVLVGTPEKERVCKAIIKKIQSPRLIHVVTPTPLDLAALLERSAGLITAAEGAAHVAACTETPSVVMWRETSFIQWKSRSPYHTFVMPPNHKESIIFEEVWRAFVETILLRKKGPRKQISPPPQA